MPCLGKAYISTPSFVTDCVLNEQHDLSTSGDVDEPCHGSRILVTEILTVTNERDRSGKVEKHAHGIATHIVSGDHENIIGTAVGICPGDLGFLTLRRRLDKELSVCRETDLDKGGGVNRETGRLSENDSEEGKKEGEGKEGDEHDCSVKVGRRTGREGINTRADMKTRRRRTSGKKKTMILCIWFETPQDNTLVVSLDTLLTRTAQELMWIAF